MVLLLKHALRRLAKAPGFTVTAVLMLGLGVAMSTLSFTTTNGVLLRPLPFHDPEQLLRVVTVSRKETLPMLSPANAIEIRDQLADIGEFGLFFPQQQNVAEPGQPPRHETGMTVSANVLKLLGVQPALGRGFLPGEDAPNQSPVVLITDRFWRERFGADPHVLGKVLRVQTTNFTVIGVLPPSFDEPLLWAGCKYVTIMTVWPSWRTERGAKWMSLMGRLRPGVSVGKAQVRLEVLARQIAHDHPVEMAADGFRAVALGPSMVAPEIRLIYWLVVGLALLVLVIACANLGAVQLARAFGRQGELAIRAALGATRTDLVATLAADSILVAAAGTALGLLVTYWTAAIFSRWIVSAVLPLDARVVAFGLAAGMIATVSFGIAPAWLITANMAGTLKETGRGTTGGGAQIRLKHALIVGQLGLALVLVSTAASLVLGVRAFTHRNRGWRPEGLVSTAFQVQWDWVTKEQKEPRLARLLETKLGAIPGVERVAVSSDVMLYGDASIEPLYIEGAEAATPGQEPRAYVASVNAVFFPTLGISLREGRLFPAEWRRTDPAVCVVSTTTARHFWPGGKALGKRLRFGKETAWREVIGVVSDATFAVAYSTPPTTLQIYRPTQELPSMWYSVVLQSRQPAIALEKSVRAAFSEIDPDLMVVDVANLSELLDSFASTGPLNPMLMTFAASGLVIALVGLYGVMSQFAQQRRRDIGVRIALGAHTSDIIRLMLGRAVGMLAIAACTGIAGSLAMALAFRRAVPELPMFGLTGDALVALALVLAGVVACYLPSARAARVNPVEVLRAE